MGPLKLCQLEPGIKVSINRNVSLVKAARKKVVPFRLQSRSKLPRKSFREKAISSIEKPPESKLSFTRGFVLKITLKSKSIGSLPA